MITPRTIARSQGLTSFETGRPCKRGHMAKRWVATGTCSECHKIKNVQRKDRIAECARNLRRGSPEVHRQRSLDWKRRNVEHNLSLNRNRQARIKAAEGHHTGSDILDLFDKHSGFCLCGHDLTLGYHVDHVIPVVRGGSNWPSNLQLLCQPRNDSKGSKLMSEWVDPIKPLIRMVG